MKKITQYKELDKRQFYIDKTDKLEKSIAIFPCIYLEGAAACGKTTAVKMMLQHHPEVEVFWVDLKKISSGDGLQRMLEELVSKMEEALYWVIFENLNRQLSEEYFQVIETFILEMPRDGRAILISRDRPAQIFLNLLWKRKMELITQKNLSFDQSEIKTMIEILGSNLKPEEVYARTGGWAGCVDMMVRMSLQQDADANTLGDSYEIETYIQNEILDEFTSEEKELFSVVCLCPWVNVTLCERVLGIQDVQEMLKDMKRKGIIQYEDAKKQWKVASLFQNQKEKTVKDKAASAIWEKCGIWYAENGYLKEALECLEQMDDSVLYHQCLLKYFDQVPFLEGYYEEVLQWRDTTPQICYLRGMHYNRKKDFKNFEHEIEKLEKYDFPGKEEVLLNLYFAKPDLSLEDWLNMLEGYYKECGTLPLYHILGESFTFLCGIRDLTELFACKKSEENRKAKIWKKCLGEWEWNCYRLARIDYYLETMRSDAISQEDWELLQTPAPELCVLDLKNSQVELVRLYLLGKLQRLQPAETYKRQFEETGKRLIQLGSRRCGRNAEAIIQMTSLWFGEPERLTQWMRYMESAERANYEEITTIESWCLAKGYIWLNQYEKAEKWLRQIITHQQAYRHIRLLAEAWFLQAIVSWSLNRKGQALQHIIESFLISNIFRYVDCYACYGQRGIDVMEAYMEWHQGNSPEGWKRKKKYQYGNVLRMPFEDYLGVVHRCIRKSARTIPVLPNGVKGDRLTMTELLILQNLSRGLSNAEICEEMNLKLPTVKSHIYSVYKKLGVNSRVQAVIKAKKMGVLEES